GLNYYLLYYDKSLVVERKVELIKEAFQHYETIGNAKHIEGIVDLVKLAKGIMKPTDLVPFLEQYFSKIKNNNEQILVGTILAEQYLNTDQYSKAFNVSKDLSNLTNDI